MKTVVTKLLFGIIIFTTTTVYADLPTNTKATRENLLEDAVIDLLEKPTYEAIEDYYGTTYTIGAFCQRVIAIKKLQHPGSWLFEVKLEFVTFTGSHKFMDIFTVTIHKDWETEGKWEVKNYYVRKYDQSEKYECRDPA
ncbi:DUF3888 domain-containing protein [Bacillus sp. OK048]|uniref:DUF3888 domain-containing protein n=1 Tax=Bacillus sp. OK048 TaxID=1882761 RepID=UPI00088B254F|nr:DUF3888 domain-containing protein [Bacillus sp. OK048]SDN92911.1 Protein of unknown function [Bacillus sp. OK048]